MLTWSIYMKLSPEVESSYHFMRDDGTGHLDSRPCSRRKFGQETLDVGFRDSHLANL
jgi:hypothetical protein